MATRNLPLYYKKADGTFAQMQYTDTTYDLLNSVYPVNSIYITIGDKSPIELFGGTWVEIPANYYLMTCGTSYTCGQTANANDLKHSHGLGAGYADYVVLAAGREEYRYKNVSKTWAANYGLSNAGTATASGLSSTHNTAMELGGTTDNSATLTPKPAYYTVRVWKRTA